MNLGGRSADQVPRRLLMTADAVGGVWAYALTLCRELSATGTQVLLATMGPPPTAAQARVARSIRNLELEVSAFALEWMDDPWQDVDRAGDWLLGLEQRFRPEIVHLNGYCHASSSFGAPKLVVGHSCVSSWWQHVLGTSAPDRYQIYRERVRAGLRAAAHVVAPTAAMLRNLQQHYGPLPAASVLANGVAFAPPPRRQRRYVLGVGRAWDPAKNAGLLARVARRIQLPVHWAGDPTGPTDQAPDLSGLRLLGHLDQRRLAEAYAGALVYAHPARYEPFGLAPVEAALSGCPLLLSDIDSLREVWEDAARYAPPQDPEAWAHAIDALFKAPSQRLQVAERARERAQAYSPRAMADAYRMLYRRLLEASEPHGRVGERRRQTPTAEAS
ncbi:MAG TPA: glycosyltransferase [Polyangiaceae bacterium]|nr:glycosyltransferase [Polyangiaceae bacterium]